MRILFHDTEEREIGRGVKQKICYIAFDNDKELKSTTESSDKKQTHMLSDGNMITVGAKRFRCTSVFPSNFIGIKASGVHDTSFHNIINCDVDISKFLSAHSSRCGSRRASTMNLARPSSIGRAFELTMLTGRI